MNLKNFPKRLDSKTSPLRITVPENLDLALEGLIRKVLREQPKTEDIYTFAADYFETLLRIRDKADLKFTASQLCPFHNDDDAHEMIKLARTFGRPTPEKKMIKNEESTQAKIRRKKETDGKIPAKKELRRLKAKENSKGGKGVNKSKQTTPDLIKKLPVMTKPPQAEEKEVKTEGKPEVEGSEEGFLMSDPIKELVEKELMMTAPGEIKTDETIKMSTNNDSESTMEETTEEKASSNDTTNEPILEKNLDEKNEEKTDKAEKVEMEKEKTLEVLRDEVIEVAGNAEVANEEIANVKETNMESTKEEKKTKSTPANITPNPKDVTLSEKIQNQSEKDKQEAEIRENSTEIEENNKTEADTDEVSTAKLLEIPNYIGGEGKSTESPVENSEDNQTTGDAAESEKGKTEKTSIEISPKEKTPTETQIDNSTTIVQQLANNTTESESLQEVSKPPLTSDNKAEEIPAGEIHDRSPVDAIKTETDEKEEKKSLNDAVGPNNKDSIMENTEESENEEKELKEAAEETNNPEIASLAEKEFLGKSEEKSIDDTKDEQKEFDGKNFNKETESEDNKSLDRRQDQTEVKVTSVEPTETNENVPDSKLTLNPSPTTDERENDSEITPAQPNKEPESLQPEKPEDDKMAEKEKLRNENINVEDEANKQEGNGKPVGNTENEGIQVEIKTATEDSQIISPKAEKPQPTEVEVDKNKDLPGEELCRVVDINNIPKRNPQEEQKEELQNTQANEVSTDKVQTDAEELCTVVDIQQIPKTEEVDRQTPDKEEKKTESEVGQTEESSLKIKADNENPPGEDNTNEETDTTKPQTEIENAQNELCTVVDTEHIPKEDQTECEKPTEQPIAEPKATENITHLDLPIAADTVIKVEEAENGEKTPEQPEEAGEIRVKTIQTHLYDSLQVPESVTKEYRVRNVAAETTAGLVGVAGLVHQGYTAIQQSAHTTAQIEETVDENMNSETEFVKTLNISPVEEKTNETAETPQPTEIANTDVIPTDVAEPSSQKEPDDSEELLDIITPSSDYSLNLSELSWRTISGLFLDSEKRYSSLEMEETRYATSRTDETKKDENRSEVEEIIEKTMLPSHLGAVPDGIELKPNLIIEEKIEENEKHQTDEKENSESESSEGSRDNDLPVVSVEVKTVIETQVLNDEEEKDGELPEVEVKVEAKIDIQQADLREMSDGENKQDAQLNLQESQTTSQDEKTTESCSTEQTPGNEGESSSTISSGATEIKRTDSSKRTMSSRNLLSTQSLDLGKRNPLVKTRSLTTFRHGVTDFEVWNRIEKELEEAATKIQSKYRGYKTRKKLQRENAVQITTEESSASTTPVEAETKEGQQQTTGEFHDSIVLSEHPR